MLSSERVSELQQIKTHSDRWRPVINHMQRPYLYVHLSVSISDIANRCWGTIYILLQLSDFPWAFFLLVIVTCLCRIWVNDLLTRQHFICIARHVEGLQQHHRRRLRIHILWHSVSNNQGKICPVYSNSHRNSTYVFYSPLRVEKGYSGLCKKKIYCGITGASAVLFLLRPLHIGNMTNKRQEIAKYLAVKPFIPMQICDRHYNYKFCFASTLFLKTV